MYYLFICIEQYSKLSDLIDSSRKFPEKYVGTLGLEKKLASRLEGMRYPQQTMWLFISTKRHLEMKPTQLYL